MNKIIILIGIITIMVLSGCTNLENYVTACENTNSTSVYRDGTPVGWANNFERIGTIDCIKVFCKYRPDKIADYICE